MSKDKTNLPQRSSSSAVEAFLKKAAAVPAVGGARGRLLFAMDATASRGPTWDKASHIQAEMFSETAALGGLDVQLAYYRGFNEFKASDWVSDARRMLSLMTSVTCLSGQTQIESVLRHAAREARRAKLNAVVFVGDCVEESLKTLNAVAGELGLLGVPVFVFHEGEDPLAQAAFEQIAKLTGGACCRFDASSPGQLKDLLSAVAVYAAGGRKALEDYGKRKGGMALKLLPKR